MFNLRSIRHLIISLCAFICFFGSEAQASIALHEINNIDLSNNAILDLYQDSDGYMWIGTYDGLNLYNGKTTHVYRFDPNNKNSLCSNIINRISYGGDNYLWISTSMGLNRFSLESREVTDSFQEYPECHLIASDSKGNTVLINLKDFISCYSAEAGQFQEVYLPDVKKDQVLKVLSADDGLYYIVLMDGSMKKLSTAFDDFPISLNVENLRIHDNTLLQAFYLFDRIYFLDVDYQLYAYDLKNHTKIHITDLSQKTFRSQRISQICYFKSELYLVFRNGILFNVNNPEHSADLNIGLFCALSDYKQDIFWFGTDGRGVQMYYEKADRFSSIRQEDLPILARNPIRSVYTDENHSLWFGAKGSGLIRISKYDQYSNIKIPSDQIRHYTVAEGLTNDRVFAIQKSKYKPWLWLGTDGPGLCYYSYIDDKIHSLSGNSNSKIKLVHAIREINDSTLWLTTTGEGLLEVKLEDQGEDKVIKSVQSYVLQKDGNICNEFHAINYDPDNEKLYLGSRGGYGMVQFDLKTRTYDFIPMNNSTNNRVIGDVLSMCYSKDSVYYLGASSGISQIRFNGTAPADILQFNREDGIKNDMVHGILEDADGCMWLSTNKGLTKYNPHNHFFHNYDELELSVTEFSDDAYWKCPYTGRLFFGGVNGLVWVDPQNNHQENFKPDLHFFELRIGNEMQSLANTNRDKGITISPDITSFSLSFIAMDYIHGQNYEYAYKLENHTNSWTSLQKENEITFTRLPFGDYTLKVRYKNDVLDSEATEYALLINVLHPWYLSIWAIIVYILLALLIGAGVLYYIKRRMIAKQQQLAQRLAEEQKEKLYEAKLNFFANITHELCTPLTLINGINVKLSDYADTDSNPQLKQYTSLMHNNVANLNELIQEILDFRKIEEQGFGAYKLKETNISVLMKRLCDSFAAIAEQQHLQFETDIPDDLFWNTDSAYFRKIITNLLSNAFKYTNKQGFVKVSLMVLNGNLQIRVYNTGTGISADEQQAVFDRYKMLAEMDGNGYSHSTERHGLGLFICHNLVDLLHGHIEVQSTVGEYAEFIVSLPILEIATSAGNFNSLAREFDFPCEGIENASQVSTVLADGEKPVLLVVDDNKDIVWLITESLSDTYQIMPAYSAKEALLQMKKQTPALIITDIMMPGTDGLSLIRQIREDKFTRDIPLIVVSAKITDKEQSEGLDNGADAYLTKPFSPAILRSVINRLLINKTELKAYYYSPESAYEQSGGQLLHQDDKAFMDSVVAIIHENIEKETLRPEFIAEQLGMNARGLYRRFKKISPLTPSDFIKDYRLTQAAQLLITSNLNVQEIIFKVGISNKSYFYREFAQKYEMTPKEYRKT